MVFFFSVLYYLGITGHSYGLVLQAFGFSVSLDSHVLKRTPKHMGLPGPISKTHGSFPYESRDSKMGVVSGMGVRVLEETTIEIEVILVATTLRVASWERNGVWEKVTCLDGFPPNLLNLKLRNGLHPFSHSHEDKNSYGGFRKWWYSQIIHFNRDVHYKSSILGYHHLRKHPYDSFAVM